MKKIKKAEIIVYLEDKSYRCHYDYWPISWNIKVREMWPANGRVDKDGRPLDLDMAIGNDPEFDELWKLYVENNHDLFWNVCASWLDFVGDNAWWDLLDGTDDPAIQAANDTGVKFYTTGRSSGHLVLGKFNGDRLSGRYSNPGWADWDYSDLWTLYKACHIVDDLVGNRHESLAHLYADFRHQKEVEWAIIAKLPACEECNKPINWAVVDSEHIENHFCQCAKPSVPMPDTFYCKNKGCTERAVSLICLKHGHPKQMCKKCSKVALAIDYWGPIEEVVSMEETR